MKRLLQEGFDLCGKIDRLKKSYFQCQLVQDRGKRIEIAVGRVARV